MQSSLQMKLTCIVRLSFGNLHLYKLVCRREVKVRHTYVSRSRHQHMNI